MKNLLFFLIGILLMSCGAKNSNVAKNKKKTVTKSEVVMTEDTMTIEEQVVADKVGAIKAQKLAEDTFLVTKLVAPEVYKSIVEWEYAVEVEDSMPLIGVVSARGRWLVPLQYHAVEQIDKDVFIGQLDVRGYDSEMEAPVLTSLYQVIYRGRPVGDFGYKQTVMPIYYHRRVAGFLKILRYQDRCWYFYIDTKGKGWDTCVGIQTGSYPHFEHYMIKNNILTLWGGGDKPEDLKAYYPEDRSLYRVDLSSGRVLEDPFVPTD